MSTILFSPHNDDETLSASFVCLREKPLVVIVLRSFVQEDLGIPYELREAETDKAMRVLGCDWEQWRYPDDDPPWGDVEREITHAANQFERAWAPLPQKNGHEHHNRIGNIVAEKFRGRSRFYATYALYPGGKTVTGKEIPYEPEWVSRKHQALACYQSQSAGPCTRHFVTDLLEYGA